jgi:hypothetical protein
MMAIHSTYSNRSLSTQGRLSDGHSADISVHKTNRSWWKMLLMINPITASLIVIWEVLTFKRLR